MATAINRKKRKIIKINEDLCNGCGQCVTSCAEGALKIIDGKAKLVNEVFCDGLGACIGECPTGALKIVEEDAPAFDEHAVKKHLDTLKAEHEKPKEKHAHGDKLPCGCPSSAMRVFETRGSGGGCPSSKERDFGSRAKPAPAATAKAESTLSHWPVQLALVNPQAPFLKGKDLVISADCVAYAYGNFHEDFLKGKSLVIACPKLDDTGDYEDKLADIFSESGVKSVTVLRMEVPCCGGLVAIAKSALAKSGVKIPAKAITIGLQGDVLAEMPI